MGLGSDSARVNEVAKLCRAVVHGMEGGRAPKVLLLALSERSMSGFRAIEDAEDKSCMIDWSVPADRRVRKRESVCHCVRWVRSSV